MVRSAGITVGRKKNGSLSIKSNFCVSTDWHAGHSRSPRYPGHSGYYRITRYPRDYRITRYPRYPRHPRHSRSSGYPRDYWS